MSKPTSADKSTPAPQRIAKVLARAGVASRRDAEKLILEGRIKVNGKRLTTPAFTVTPKDKILFDDKPIGAKQPPRLWRYHKPAGLVTSHRDEKGRQTVFDTLPKELGRVISIGRLDITSEGLLLLTNDGELARLLELPSTGWSRRYRARAYGKVDQDKLDTLQDGILIDGVKTGPIEAVLDSQKGDNVWVSVVIREGKNREVRRAMEHLGLTVNRLIRVSYGPFLLGHLDKGEVEEVKYKALNGHLGQLIDIPEPVEPKRRAPKRGSHASAKRFQNKPDSATKTGSKKSGDPKKPAPKGRGKFAKASVKASGKPGGKFQGKFAPRSHKSDRGGPKSDPKK